MDLTYILARPSRIEGSPIYSFRLFLSLPLHSDFRNSRGRYGSGIRGLAHYSVIYLYLRRDLQWKHSGYICAAHYRNRSTGAINVGEIVSNKRSHAQLQTE